MNREREREREMREEGREREIHKTKRWNTKTDVVSLFAAQNKEITLLFQPVRINKNVGTNWKNTATKLQPWSSSTCLRLHISLSARELTDRCLALPQKNIFVPFLFTVFFFLFSVVHVCSWVHVHWKISFSDFRVLRCDEFFCSGTGACANTLKNCKTGDLLLIIRFTFYAFQMINATAKRTHYKRPPFAWERDNAPTKFVMWTFQSRTVVVLWAFTQIIWTFFSLHFPDITKQLKERFKWTHIGYSTKNS